MNPESRAFQPSDLTNLQQQNIMDSKPISGLLPTPLLTSNNGNPPPVPPRTSSSYQSTMPGSVFGYGMNPYAMNQNFGYGGFMPGYGNPMMQGSILPQDSVLHGVEDVGRSAFQTVGSVVQTLSSVSMMLQSTLFAVQNSVQAVVSVANQFGHLRSHLIEMCISAIRIIRYYYRKLLYLFRLDRRSGVDKLWDEAAHQTTHGNQRGGILLFFAVVIGTPYLLWSLIKSIISQSNSINKWHKGEGEHFVGEADFTYEAVNSDELSVTSGDTIYIAPKHKQPVIKGWILAAKGGKTGLVPANYIKIHSKGNTNINNKNSKIEELKESERELLSDMKTSTVPDLEMSVPDLKASTVSDLKTSTVPDLKTAIVPDDEKIVPVEKTVSLEYRTDQNAT